jgi:hypothetical protein
MDTAAAYYLPENSLEQVTIPILLFIAEQDQYTQENGQQMLF